MSTENRCFIVGAADFDGFLTGEDAGENMQAGREAQTVQTARATQAGKTTQAAQTAAPRPGDLLIAADGGYRYLREMGVEPDVLLGDFDSLEMVPEHRHLIRHSPIKDDTDMALAVAYAKAEGYRTFFLYGGLGGRRLDHTIANLQLLTGMAREGLTAYLIGSGTIITAVTDGKLSFPGSAAGMISVFCMGEQACGVYERGLKYTLEDAVLTCDRALGVSNEFTGEAGTVEVRSGTILVLWDARNGLPERELLNRK